MGCGEKNYAAPVGSYKKIALKQKFFMDRSPFDENS